MKILIKKDKLETLTAYQLAIKIGEVEQQLKNTKEQHQILQEKIRSTAQWIHDANLKLRSLVIKGSSGKISLK